MALHAAMNSVRSHSDAGVGNGCCALCQVDYDRNAARRTTVIDDQADFFEIDSNAWLSDEARPPPPIAYLQPWTSVLYGCRCGRVPLVVPKSNGAIQQEHQPCYSGNSRQHRRLAHLGLAACLICNPIVFSRA